MLEYFDEWALKTAAFKELTNTVNSSGQVVESETAIATLTVNYWTDESRETNINDKFVDQATGSILVRNGDLTPNTNMWAEIDSKVHYITGVNDMGGLSDFYLLKWRREL